MRHTCTVRGRLASRLLAPCIVAGASLAQQFDLPPFFEAVPVTGTFYSPTSMAFAPDGTFFVASKGGIVVYHDGTTTQNSFFIDLRDEVNVDGDRGLLGMAVPSRLRPGRGDDVVGVLPLHRLAGLR